MSAKRQKIQDHQLLLAFPTNGRGEAPRAVAEGTEVDTVERVPERPATSECLMEEVCQRGNMRRALKRVKRNKGSPGIDGMTVGELPDHLRAQWSDIREHLLRGTYRPHPVRRVRIPKPGGGVRNLGIPTVLDRLVQQAVLQVLQGRWDRTFSEHSFGFRPGRSAHQAVAQAQRYVAEGYNYVVDMDLEKFFDRVNHDMLMGRIAKRIPDKRLLKLIRSFLNAGVMENGLVNPTEEGTPQGGPLSPLLSNLVLDDLDHELEKRGHRFVRYADDCNIYVRSERAGRRVMEGVSRYITQRLKLRVNQEKSAVARPWARTFLGFSFTSNRPLKRRLASRTLVRFKKRVRKLTDRNRSIRVEQMIEVLARYLKGWRGYFAYCETPYALQKLDSWIRRRLRAVFWKQWKTGRRRYAELRRRSINAALAAKLAGSARGPWRISRSHALVFALPNAFFSSLGLPAVAPVPSA